jgi:molybdenum cofactor biosynthesis enzyme MoaA
MTATCTTSPAVIPLDLKPGIPKLASIYYNPTSYCNLKCTHCWIAPPYKKSFTEANPKELTLEQVSSLYDQGRALGLTATKLTGGEPLLRYGIKDILWLIHEKVSTCKWKQMPP